MRLTQPQLFVFYQGGHIAQQTPGPEKKDLFAVSGFPKSDRRGSYIDRRVGDIRPLVQRPAPNDRSMQEEPALDVFMEVFQPAEFFFSESQVFSDLYDIGQDGAYHASPKDDSVDAMAVPDVNQEACGQHIAGKEQYLRPFFGRKTDLIVHVRQHIQKYVRTDPEDDSAGAPSVFGTESVRYDRSASSGKDDMKVRYHDSPCFAWRIYFYLY